MSGICMLSFDVEDYFQVGNLRDVIGKSDWERITLRVADNTERILDILDKHETRATFFILGWVAERVPDLVSKIHEAGHEVASHGYGHDLVYKLNEDEFREDIRRSKRILGEITGEKALGYRAPDFSISEKALDILKDEGFLYDSSLFPSIMHDRYGKLDSFSLDNGCGIGEAREGLYEVVIPTLGFLGKRLPWGGGAYFRMLPYRIYRAGLRRILRKQGSFVFYLHPWEIDPEQPRIEGMRLSSRVRHYTGQNHAERKLGSLVRDFEFTTILNGLQLLSDGGDLSYKDS